MRVLQLLFLMAIMVYSEDSTAVLSINDTNIIQEDTTISDISVVKQLILSRNTEYSPDSLDIIANAIIDESEKYDNVTHTLLAAIITKESNFNRKAKSNMNAKGLGGIMGRISKFACDSLGITFFNGIEYNPVVNIKITAWFLNWCIKKEKGNLDLGLAHYNGGPRNAWRYKCYMKYLNNTKLSPLESLGISRLPKETKHYVSQVKKIDEEYIKISSSILDVVDVVDVIDPE